jgi:hypothetical protein
MISIVEGKFHPNFEKQWNHRELIRISSDYEEVSSIQVKVISDF